MANTPHLWVVDHSERDQVWMDPELFFAAFFSEANPLVRKVATPGTYDARMKLHHRDQIVGARQLSTSAIAMYAQSLLEMDESFFVNTATQIALLEGVPEDIAALCLLMKIPDAKFRLGTMLRDASGIELTLKPHLSPQEKSDFCADTEFRLCPYTEYIREMYMTLMPYFNKGVLDKEIGKSEADFANSPMAKRAELFENFFAFQSRSPIMMLGVMSHIGKEDGHVLQAPQFYYGGNA